MEPNLLKYVWRHSRKEQIWMLIIILLSMPTYFLSLELPKRIVNGPIQGLGFESPDDVGHFLQTYLPVPDWILGEPILLFSGFELERIPFLLALSLTFLGLVAANGLFKLYINTFKGRMGERILRRLRFQLFDRVLRYPLPRFRRTKSSEVATMIKDEVEPMGEFIGDAYTLPLFLGGQALTGLTFIFLQNTMLGFATLVIVVIQAWLVPRLRRRLIQLGKQRQIASRELAGRLGEIVDGIQDAHTNDTTNYERANISDILGRLYFIRFELFQRKFGVKFINNLLIQFLAFLFYAVGGYLAITGTMDIGQLVAVIAAYKDLPDPIRGLIDYDQRRLTVEVRYEQILEQFAADDLQDPETQITATGPVPQLSKGFDISNLAVTDETGTKLIEKASVTINIGEQLAIVGAVNSGSHHMAEVLARVLKPTSGRVYVDGTPIDDLPEYVTGRRISYVDGGTFFPQTSILNALTYVLKNQPIVDRDLTGAEEALYMNQLAETRRAANIELDFNANWVDYDRAGVKGPSELIEEIRSILVDVQLEEDIRGFGLRGTLDPAEYGDLCDQLIIARKRFKARLSELGFEDFVEPFEPNSYNIQASVAENLLFGTALDSAYKPENLASNPIVQSILVENDLEDALFEMGKEVAATTVDLFGDLAPDNPFFDQLNYMDAEDLPEYKAALTRIGNLSISKIDKEDRLLIMKLPFSYTENKNRLGLLTDDLRARILEARKSIRLILSKLKVPPVAFFETESYNPAASVLDNVLLGRVATNVAEGSERVDEAIKALLDEMGLTDDIFHIGLDFNIGTGGKRLSEIQRQKLHLARALLKKPDFLIVNRALNSLDSRSQRNIIENVLKRARNTDGHPCGVIWVPINPKISLLFDRVLLFSDGELIADGNPDDMNKSQPQFQELLNV